MNLKAKKDKLVDEFNQNRNTAIMLKKQTDGLLKRQVQIEAQLILIKEIEKGEESPPPAKKVKKKTKKK